MIGATAVIRWASRRGAPKGSWLARMLERKPIPVLKDAIRNEITSAINDRPTPREAWEPEVDSLVMVRVVFRVEEELALSLPDDVMPSGGFDGVEHCVAIVMETCRELWNANQRVTEEV